MGRTAAEAVTVSYWPLKQTARSGDFKALQTVYVLLFIEQATRRPQQGLDQDNLLGLAVSAEGSIRYRNVLGGIICDYYRAAA